MANQIVCVLAETYGLRIYAIMLPPSDFSVAHCEGIDDMCRVEHIVFLSLVR